MYANAIAAQAITKYRLIRHTGISQHLPIEITFRAAALRRKHIAIQPPAAFPVDEHQRSEEEQESADQRIASQYTFSLEASRVQGDAETAWEIFHKKLRRNGCAKMLRRTKDQLENEDEDDSRSWWIERLPPQRGAPRTCSRKQRKHDAARRL